MYQHLSNTFNSISTNQWFGLLLALLASSLAWVKLIFIISPLKNNKPNIGKYQIYALFISWIITVISWAKYLAIVDPINNKKD
tara:strand:+ start:115 stop:363 length:249 start_codon:yes stop_codon:yes gene_type:complete